MKITPPHEDIQYCIRCCLPETSEGYELKLLKANSETPHLDNLLAIGPSRRPCSSIPSNSRTAQDAVEPVSASSAEPSSLLFFEPVPSSSDMMVLQVGLSH